MASTIHPPSKIVLVSAALLSYPSCLLRLLSWLQSADGSTILPPSTFVLACAVLLSSPSCWLQLLSWLLSADGFYYSATLNICAHFCLQLCCLPLLAGYGFSPGF